MASRNRYTIMRKVADGGMAEIYLATQHGAAGFERPIIIKRIRAAFSADPQFRSMLVDEAHIAMALTHGNIAQVLDLGTSGGQWFMVMELVDGWDVNTLLRRGRVTGSPLSIPLALHITAQICRALAFAHSRTRNGQPLKIVHRDVSPENILVSEQGEVKLADFGIATAVNKRDRTSVGLVKGKLGFMSPEQASGKTLDGRSDLYGLGCALYLMCTGVSPFQGKTDLEVLLRHQEGAFVPPQDVAPQLPSELVALLLRALQKNPLHRFATADEMLTAVEELQRKLLAPAGQTELKRWMEELAARDGVPPTSKRPPPQPQEPPDGAADDEEVELARGAGLVLEEVDTTSSPMMVNTVEVIDTVETPHLPAGMQAESRRRGWRTAGLALVLAGVAGSAGWITLNDGELPEPWETALVTAEKEVSGWLGLPTPMEDTALPPPPPPRVRQTATLPAPPEQIVEADAGAATPEPTAPVAVEAAAQTPEAGTAVDAGAAAPVTVSVRFLSQPAGATVMVNGKAFGTTPMSIRFKPGLTHDVVFQLEGYADASRRVYVSTLRSQTVQVNLVAP